MSNWGVMSVPDGHGGIEFQVMRQRKGYVEVAGLFKDEAVAGNVADYLNNKEKK